MTDKTTPHTPSDDPVAALRGVFWSDEVEAPNDPAEMYRLLTAAGWTLTRGDRERPISAEPDGDLTPTAALFMAGLTDTDPEEYNALRQVLLRVQREARGDRERVLREHVLTLANDISYIDLALDIDDAEWDQMRSHVRAALAEGERDVCQYVYSTPDPTGPPSICGQYRVAHIPGWLDHSFTDE